MCAQDHDLQEHVVLVFEVPSMYVHKIMAYKCVDLRYQVCMCTRSRFTRACSIERAFSDLHTL